MRYNLFALREINVISCLVYRIKTDQTIFFSRFNAHIVVTINLPCRCNEAK